MIALIFALFLAVLRAEEQQTATLQPFKCNFQMHQKGSMGYFNGNLQYDWNAKKTLVTFSTSRATELNIYNKSGGYPAPNTDGLTQTSTSQAASCSCSTATIPTQTMPIMHSSLINGYLTKATGSDYKPLTSASHLLTVSFDSKGYPLTASFDDGQIFTYTGCAPFTPNSKDFTIPTGCSCTKPTDIVLVLDRSCSISNANWVLEKGFVTGLVGAFNVMSDQTNIGITNFHTKTWDGPVTLSQGVSNNAVQTGASSLQCFDRNKKVNDPSQQCKATSSNLPPNSCCGCGTCISAGVINGADMLAASKREEASKVLIVLTDGYHDLVLDIDQNGNLKRDSNGKPYGITYTAPGNKNPCGEVNSDVTDPCFKGLTADLQWATNYAVNKVKNIKIYAIGVGPVPRFHQLQVIAQGQAGQVLSTKDWDMLYSFVDTLTKLVCPTSTPCPSGCCGFCACAKNCILPDGCLPGNLCLPPGGSCCSVPTTPSTTVCSVADKCVTTSCDPNGDKGKGSCITKNVPVTTNTTCLGYRCDSKTGSSVPIPLTGTPCGINDACTQSVCKMSDPTQTATMSCTTTKTDCTGKDLCFTYGCDVKTGCTKTSIVPKNTSCLSYTCNPTTGKVSSSTALECCPSCDDKNACTKDVTNPGDCACKHTPIECTTTDLCKTASCDKVKGCVLTTKPIPANTSCTNYICNPKTGIVSSIDLCCSTLSCDDGNFCTTDVKDRCNCTHTPIKCTLTTDKCKQTTCVPSIGCSTTPIKIPKNTNCNTYTCDSATGVITNYTQVNCCPSCDDHNACTTDITNPGDCKCSHKPITCTGKDLCYTYTCDPKKGCVQTHIPMPNNTRCTIWTCDPVTGVSSWADLCCTNQTCDDNNMCTNDIKSDCQCSHTKLQCPNNPDKCKTVSCDPKKGCVSTAIPLPRDDECNHYVCDSKTGIITPQDLCCRDKSCDDNNACTLDIKDKCKPCNHTSIKCETPTNKCKQVSCVPARGCVISDIAIPKNTACNTYTCDPATGFITNYTQAKCCPSCDDKNACTQDVANAGDCKCSHLNVTCAGGDKCVTYSCDPVKSCITTPKPIANNTRCTTYRCDPSTGKVSSTDLCCTGEPCDDNNVCTKDIKNDCDCSHVPIPCNTTDKCKSYYCDPKLGCQFTLVPVPPNTRCTTYTCDSKTGQIVSKDLCCTGTPCDDNNLCTTDVKNDCNCTHVPIKCTPSQDKCKHPECYPKTGCASVLNPIPADTPCNKFTCDSNTGKITNFTSLECCPSCDDKNACTVDVTHPGDCNCTHLPVTCKGDNKCVTYKCDVKSGCIQIPNPMPNNTRCDKYSCDTSTGKITRTDLCCTNQTCDDKNVCTKDIKNDCDCSHQVIPCNTTDKCMIPTCDPVKGCLYTHVPMPPNSECTTHVCDSKTGTISAVDLCCTSKSCDDNNACTIDTKNKCNCTHTNVTCDVPTDKCKKVTCEVEHGCVVSPIAIPANTSCNFYTCDPLTAHITNITALKCCPSCDDNNACTKDITNPGDCVCSHFPLNCTGSDRCYTYSCDSVKGCINTTNPIKPSTRCDHYKCDPLTGLVSYHDSCCQNATCDDSDLCTTDVKTDCNCSHKPFTCPLNPNKCLIVKCDSKKGCITENVKLPNNTNCTQHICHEDTGVIEAKDLCCVTTPDLCDDNDLCTTDIKFGCNCTHIPVKCNLTHTQCQNVTCDPAVGCKVTQNPIPKDTNCNQYTCDPTTGIIKNYTSVQCCPSCDDNNACTVDITNPGDCNCSHKPSTCASPDNCSVAVCDKINGCQITKKPINNNTRCDMYTCNLKTGEITHTDLCCRNETCNDNNLCTTDVKEDCKCTFVPIVCANSTNKCNISSCDKEKGCIYKLTPVPNNTKCDIFSCDPQTGTIKTADACCRNETCEVADLCVISKKEDCNCSYSPVNCTIPDSKCVNVHCDSKKGCVTENVPVPPNDTCHTYTCDPATGQIINKTRCSCVNCDDNNLCTDDSVVGENCTCVHTPVNCTGNDKCVTYSCNVTKGCYSITKPVQNSTSCDRYACIPATGVIEHTDLCPCRNMSCDDKSVCTNDTRTDCTCSHTPIPCPVSSNKCILVSCDAVKGCVNKSVAVPNNTECDHFQCDPATGTITTFDVCCRNETCDDNNACTDDKKDKCNCTHTEVKCAISSDKCQESVCNPATGCGPVPISMPDDTECNSFSCDPATGNITNFTQVECCPSCDDENACTQDVTTPGTCECTHTNLTCSKANLCLEYTCDVTLGCVNTTKPLNSTRCNQCTCNPSTGNVTCIDVCCTNMTCDDNNMCTNDTKDDCTCNNVPISCPESTDKCIVASCDAKSGCKNTSVLPPETDCNWFTCDSITGIVTNHTKSGCCPACPPLDLCHNVTVENGTCNCVYGKNDTCPNTDKCKTFSCDPLEGCVGTDNPVPEDTCLHYTCDPLTGNFTSTEILNACDDNNKCTLDECVVGTPGNNLTAHCNNTKITCDDEDPCTIDTCDEKTGCVYTPRDPKFCDDDDLCTIDSCNHTSTNLTYPCEHVPVICNQSDACHEVVCKRFEGCVDEPITCPTTDNCTISGCNATKGCYVESAGICGAPVAAVGGIAGGAIAGVLCAAVGGTLISSSSAVTAFTAAAGSPLNAAVSNNPAYVGNAHGGDNPLYQHAV